MKKKIFACLAVFAFVFSAFSVGYAQTKGKTDNQLMSLLPPSEAAASIDARRFFGEALPQILSSNQPLLSEILTKFDEMKTKAGVDYKQFHTVAVGVSSIKAVENGYDYEPIVLARGQFNSFQLMLAVKTAANGKFREEKIGERVVYVFSPQAAIEKNKDKINNSKIAEYLNKFLPGVNKEMALTPYDTNTLVFGSVSRVREMFESKTRISAEVMNLASRKPGAVVNFGALTPTGLSQYIELDMDELGQNLNGVRQVSGSLDVVSGSTLLSIGAKTVDVAQAKGLKETITSLQSLFAPILKNSKREDQKIHGRMLESAKVAQTGNELTLDVQVPQTDLNVIVGAKK
jgi:hypothetical protein